MFSVARCEECEVDMPFGRQVQRDEWADTHRSGTGHTVTLWFGKRDALVPDVPAGR